LELGEGTPLARDEALREGLTNVVRFVRVSGEQKASMIVDPPALGRVSVELTNSATGLEASIKVSSEQIRQLVQDQLTQLRWSLAQQGVQLTHFSVDVQQEDGGRRQQETGRERRRIRGLSGPEDGADVQDEQAGFRVDLDRGLLYWVA
jgi:flagellar hook-length control protein FliK